MALLCPSNIPPGSWRAQRWRTLLAESLRSPNCRRPSSSSSAVGSDSSSSSITAGTPLRDSSMTDASCHRTAAEWMDAMTKQGRRPSGRREVIMTGCNHAAAREEWSQVDRMPLYSNWFNFVYSVIPIFLLLGSRQSTEWLDWTI